MNFLTTGSLSGLGRYIHETLGGIGWTRQLPSEHREKIRREGVDVIVHCAFNARQSIDSNCLYAYLADNVLLTKELISVPHWKFIFISSVGVYPRQPGFHSENEVIRLNAVDGIYGITKLMSEAIVTKHCPNHLILRPVSLLGKYSRRNTVIRIIEDNPCNVTLSDDSRYNIVLHSDVRDFIRFAIEHDIQGVLNVASSETVELVTLAAMLGKEVSFGAHRYDVGNIDNRKISSIFPAFRQTSREVIAQFFQEQTLRGQR